MTIPPYPISTSDTEGQVEQVNHTRLQNLLDPIDLKNRIPIGRDVDPAN